jgi:hypothetical protein
MWAIVEVITTCLSPMVNACMMNQFKSHWSLSNALSNIIDLTMALESKPNSFANGVETFYQFNVQFQFLKKNAIKGCESNKIIFAIFEII